MRTLIEFLVAAGLALGFHFGLKLEREAYILLGVGILLTLAVHWKAQGSNGRHRGQIFNL